MKISYFYYTLCIILLFIAAGLGAEPPKVLVSVAPHRFLVERIAGDTVSVRLLVPAGASAHTYEPTPKQVLELSTSDLWLRIGESFEPVVLKALSSYNPSLRVVDLRDHIPLIYAAEGTSCCQCHGKNSADLHFWLSARMASIQASTITDALTSLLPENAARYEEALQRLQQELKETDQSISSQLEPLQQRILMASHPAYAYFCRDYGLRQLSIEVEGKDPTPQTMHKQLQLAKSLHINKIFIQPQYGSKGAYLFAKELNAQVISLDPYAENIILSLHEIADALTQRGASSAM